MKPIIAIALGLILLSGCCGMIGEPSSNVDISVSMSPSGPLKVGDSGRIIVTIDNGDGYAHKLDSIDMDEDFFQGVIIVGSDPEFNEMTSMWDFKSFDFQYSIPADSEQTVEFDVVGAVPGAYTGEVSVCIDGPAICADKYLSFSVVSANSS